MGELEDVLKNFSLKPKEPETFVIQMDAADIMEMNCDLMKRIGKPKEAEAFQFILDHDLSNSFDYESRNSKSFLSASEYVNRIQKEKM